MESGNIDEEAGMFPTSEQMKSLADIMKPLQEEYNRKMFDLQERMILGLPEVWKISYSGEVKLLSVEESLEILDKNSIDLEDKNNGE